MIRPSSLIRGDEPTTPRIEANATNISKESLDCGITALGCCNTHCCQKLGTSKVFLIVFVLVGIFQGAIERYFVVSTIQAAFQFGYDPVLVGWLLATSGINQGLLAVFIAYWGNRIHRISWLGGILILQAILSMTVIIPILTNSSDDRAIVAHQVNALCTERTIENLSNEIAYSVTTLMMLFVLQFGIAVGNIAFYALGLSYLDDNVLEHHSAAAIGAALAAKVWGIQWGSAIYYGVSATPFGWWLGWTIIAPIFFVLAILISLFPKRLISTVVRQAADNIVEVATNSSQLSLSPHKLLADISLGSSLWRLFTNKILIFNILAIVFVQTAVVNFFLHEDSYLQSRFNIPTDGAAGLSNEWTSRIMTTLLKPPFVALSILLGGLVIAKTNPSARKITAWNVFVATLVALLFVAFIFISCSNQPIAGAYNGKLTKPYCSRSCVCDADIQFSPVCPREGVQTFYSPCHAGCQNETTINGIRIFTNCSCGIDSEIALYLSDGEATEGSCGYADCQLVWIIFMVLTIFGASILGSAIVGTLLISIRCVLPQDKALALSLELAFLGLIVYIPGKLGYQSIANMTCQFWSHDSNVCYLHEAPLFGNLLNIVSASLIAVGILFYVLVFIFVDDLLLYGDDADNFYRPIPMQPMQQQQERQSQFFPSENDENNQYEPFIARNGERVVQSPSNPAIENVVRFETQPVVPALVSQQMLQQSSPTNSSLPGYARVQRAPHTAELEMHLQTMNENAENDPDMNVLPSRFSRRIFGSDINPSVGDISDRESDLDIRQLENSVSPLNGHGSSASPIESNQLVRPQQNIARNNSDRQMNPSETDF